MALKPPSPSSESRVADGCDSALSLWLAGLSWVLLLLLIPLALMAAGLEAGLLAGRPHG